MFLWQYKKVWVRRKVCADLECSLFSWLYAVLHEHAINGHFGPKGTMMPPRGGNDALTDDEVKSAVNYMVAASR